MRTFFIFILLLSFHLTVIGQSIINWMPDYQLKLSDFQSPQTEINPNLTNYSIYSGNNLDFSFQMNVYVFWFTKDFNENVSCTFNRNAAIIVAPDSTLASQLLDFGQYSLDLTELYARKLRKELFEMKRFFSSTNFYQPIFNRLKEEMNSIHAEVAKKTDLGRNQDILKQEHKKVLSEIDSFSAYCKTCKPFKD